MLALWQGVSWMWVNHSRRNTLSKWPCTDVPVVGYLREAIDFDRCSMEPGWHCSMKFGRAVASSALKSVPWVSFEKLLNWAIKNCNWCDLGYTGRAIAFHSIGEKRKSLKESKLPSLEQQVHEWFLSIHKKELQCLELWSKKTLCNIVSVKRFKLLTCGCKTLNTLTKLF